MIAATYCKNEGFRIEDIPVPECGSEEILLRVKAASICGTDVKIIRNGHRKLKEGQKIVLGHEFVGVIVKTGRNVSGYSEGQRVGLAPNAGCGLCQACISGMANYCPEYTAFGIDMDGGHAEYVRIPAKFIRQGNVNILPETLSDPVGSVLEPFSCVVNGARKSQIVLGDTVVIFGAGPIGMMHLMLVNLLGAAKIIMVDINAERLQKALDAGAGHAIDSTKEDVKKSIMALTSGRGADVIITACPVREVQEMATDLLAPFGRLSIFGGLPAGSSKIQFDSNAVHYRNLVVTGTTGGSVDDYRRGMQLAVNGKVDLASIVSDSFPIGEMEAAYLKAQDAPSGKVVILNK